MSTVVGTSFRYIAHVKWLYIEMPFSLVIKTTKDRLNKIFRIPTSMH